LAQKEIQRNGAYYLNKVKCNLHSGAAGYSYYHATVIDITVVCVVLTGNLILRRR